MNILAGYRNRLGMTQLEMADYFKVTQSEISKMEKDNRQLHYKRARMLIKLLKQNGILKTMDDMYPK